MEKIFSATHPGTVLLGRRCSAVILQGKKERRGQKKVPQESSDCI